MKIRNLTLTVLMALIAGCLVLGLCYWCGVSHGLFIAHAGDYVPLLCVIAFFAGFLPAFCFFANLCIDKKISVKHKPYVYVIARTVNSVQIIKVNTILIPTYFDNTISFSL